MFRGLETSAPLLVAAVLFATGASHAKQPNILFIAIDDLRPELGCYGHEEIVSPNIDRLAKAGTLFERAYCQVPVCGASRASLMTGLYPTSERFVTYYTTAEADAPGIPDIPSWLKKHGYTTISNGKIYHDVKDSRASWDELFRPQDFKIYHKPENVGLPSGQQPAFEDADVDDSKYAGGAVAERAIRDLRKAKKSGKPLFLALGFTKPHLPFNAPKKYWDLYDRDKLSLADNPMAPEGAPSESIHQWEELRRMYGGIPEEGPLSEELARTLIHGYYACVSYSDALVGKVLAELDRLEMRDNTVVVLWGDHGWQLGDHSMWCKHALYKTSLQAPLIISAPGLEAGQRCSSLVEFVDLYPTLCDLAGIDPPEHLQGKSLLPLLEDPEAPFSDAVFGRYHGGEAVKTDRFHFAEWTGGARMLYDHDKDPNENVNVAGNPEYRKVVERMSAKLKTHRERIEKLNEKLGSAPGSSGGPVWNARTFRQDGAFVGQAYKSHVNWRVKASDTDKLVFTKVSGPGWLKISNPNSGRITGTPDEKDLGENVFIVSVSDGVNPAAQARMELTVKPADAGSR